MDKEYCWSSNGLHESDQGDYKTVTFTFTEKESGKSKKVLVKVSNPLLNGWRDYYEQQGGKAWNDIKLLCWIAKEDGLKKGRDTIEVFKQNYSECPCNPDDISDVSDGICAICMPDDNDKKIGYLSELGL